MKNLLHIKNSRIFKRPPINVHRQIGKISLRRNGRSDFYIFSNAYVAAHLSNELDRTRHYITNLS